AAEAPEAPGGEAQAAASEPGAGAAAATGAAAGTGASKRGAPRTSAKVAAKTGAAGAPRRTPGGAAGGAARAGAAKAAGEAKQAGPAGKAAAAKGPDSAADAGGEGPPDWEAERRRLEKTLATWQRSDHFTVMGLKRQCTGAEVKLAYAGLVRRYHPDRAVGAPEAVKTLLRELFERVNEANAVLSDDAKRRAYINELAAAELARERARSDPLAEVRELLEQKRFEQAGMKLDELLAQNPGLAPAWAWRAYVKVRRAKDRNAVKREAVELVNRALKMDPRCAECFVAAGRIAELFGDKQNALRYLKKAKALSEVAS
ncbi:MAG: J domain-containing protein, partial [Deltaproteobacteria bacterium]